MRAGAQCRKGAKTAFVIAALVLSLGGSHPAAAADRETCTAKGTPQAQRIEACTRWYAGAPDKVVQAQALAQRANAHLAFSKNDEALADARAALALNPAESFAAWIAGVVLNLRGEHGAALAMYSQTLTWRPKQMLARFERAAIHRRLGNSAAARADLDEVLRLDPKYARAFCLRADLSYADRDFAGALKDATQGLDLAPNDAVCQLQRAKTYLERGDLARAKADVEAAIATAPRTPENFLVLGRVHWMSGKAGEAAAEFEKYFALLPSRKGTIGVVEKGLSDFTLIYVSPGSPAAQAGLQANDVVTAVDGIRVANLKGDHLAQLQDAPPGTVVTLDVKGKTGAARRVAILRSAYWNAAQPALQSAEPMGTVGIRLVDRRGQLIVLDVVPDGPAHKAGVRIGDRIVAIDASPVTGIPMRAITDKIRGPAGSTVVLEVIGEEGGAPRRLPVNRVADTMPPAISSGATPDPEPDRSSL